MKRFMLMFNSVLFIMAVSASAITDDTEAIRQRLLAEPPQVVADAAAKNPDRAIQVNFLRADLDGSRTFRFIVASYSQDRSGWGVYLRVFRQEASGLQFLGEQEDQNPHGGYGLTINLVDIDGDGVPELDLSGTDSSGRQVMHEYFHWTGASLHELLDPVKEIAADASLEDIDGDGSLELVVKHGISKYVIYKFDGANFTLFKVVDRDPQGLIASDGKIHKVRALLARLDPRAFTLAEIQSPGPTPDGGKQQSDKDDEENGKIKLILGELRDLNGKTVPVEEVDTTTLLLGRNLRPLQTAIHPHEHKAGTVLELEFARKDVLHILPKLKLTAPVIPGDKLALSLVGKLKDGTRLSGISSAEIRGNRDDGGAGHPKHSETSE